MPNEIKIFLFCDALGYEIVTRHRFMEAELPYRYKVETQFGYSSAAVPTILCGEPPQVHRHFCFFFFDRKGETPFKVFRWLHPFLHPAKLFNNHRVRNLCNRLIRKWKGFTGYFNIYQLPYRRLPLFDYCEKRDIYGPGALAPAENLRDVLDKSGLKWHISDWRRPDCENFAEAVRLLKEGEKEFLFIYSGEIDAMLHFHVHQPDFVAERLKGLAADIRQILEAAREKYDSCRFYLISDHGMTPLKGAVDLRSRLEKLPFRFGRDFAANYDSTMIRCYILNEACRAPIREALLGAPGHWLTAEEKRAFGIDFEDGMYGDEIFLLDSGMQLVPGDMGSRPIPGMHGYAPDDPGSYASCLANCDPGEAPQKIADFFRLMRREAEGRR